MKQYFRAQLEGSYLGHKQRAAPSPGARYRLQIYRAVLRELSWIDPPDPSQSRPAHPAALWQAAITQTQVPGIRGPGTLYEGPICDVQLEAVRLTYPTEHRGRSYGRITGVASGWLELPPPPAPPEVALHEQVLEPGRSLEATLYTQPFPSAEAEDPLDPNGPEPPQEPTQADASTRPVAEVHAPLLPAVALATALGVALLAASGAFAAVLFAAFVLPTLVARRFFRGVLRDSAFLRGVGISLITAQLICGAALLRNFTGEACVQPELWPALLTALWLFPAGVLPARAPVLVGMLMLAVAIAGATPGRPSQCAPSVTVVPAEVEEALGVNP